MTTLVLDKPGVSVEDALKFFPSSVCVDKVVVLSHLNENLNERVNSLLQIGGPFIGILTGGGSDIHPNHYNQKTHMSTYIDRGHDALAWEVMGVANEMAFPVFGICRGFQLLWTVSGGTMSQDIKSPSSSMHPTQLLNSRLTKTFPTYSKYNERYRMQVNSLHHQAAVIGNPSPDTTRIIAVTPVEGLDSSLTQYKPMTSVEAAIDFERGWAGVQYHPEYLSCPEFGLSLAKDLIHELCDYYDYNWETL